MIPPRVVSHHHKCSWGKHQSHIPAGVNTSSNLWYNDQIRILLQETATCHNPSPYWDFRTKSKSFAWLKAWQPHLAPAHVQWGINQGSLISQISKTPKFMKFDTTFSIHQSTSNSPKFTINFRNRNPTGNTKQQYFLEFF